MYQSVGILFDDQKPGFCLASNCKIPESVTVVAVENGKFRSKEVSFKPFDVIPPPTVYFDARDNLLRVDTLPNFVYKYTLDGSTPSWGSFTYTAPVMVPRDPKSKSIKVAVFPKHYFPSKCIEIVRDAPAEKHVPSSASQQIKMTKSSLSRAISPRNQSPSRHSSPTAPYVCSLFDSNLLQQVTPHQVKHQSVCKEYHQNRG